MTNFDSLCDKSAPGMFVDIDAMWRATMDVATSRAPAERMVVALCPNCEGGGWECYGIGKGDPHFCVCSECGNPKGLDSP